MTSESLTRYRHHLRATFEWLLRSIEAGGGGSAAYFSPLSGWSAPYPETSGYIVPTLLEGAGELRDPDLKEAALNVGEWLLTLQHEQGWWPGGLYRAGHGGEPSVFNTAQIIDGMAALAHHSGDERWRDAAIRAALWLADGVDAHGAWSIGGYRKGANPSYYTQAAWPMLMAWKLGADDGVRAAAVRVLRRIVALRDEKGAFRGWSFDPDKPAFTHTIAYTLRGFIESAALLNDWTTFGAPCNAALERLARKAEFNQGRLPGAYYEDWRPVNWYTCLTGNAQVALCLLRLDERAPDLRLVNAAAKLVDHVCGTQNIARGRADARGAVAGSAPLWGRYMFMRYPNWAAKYHADALMLLARRLRQEGLQ